MGCRAGCQVRDSLTLCLSAPLTPHRPLLVSSLAMRHSPSNMV